MFSHLDPTKPCALF